MARLFVDCDDTLIIWLDEHDQPLEGQNPYGGGSQRWEFNDELVRAIEDAQGGEFIGAEVVVWSGGGADYAGRWRDRIWGFASAASKDLRLPGPDDLCIDDQPIKVACPVMTWQEFVTEGQE